MPRVDPRKSGKKNKMKKKESRAVVMGRIPARSGSGLVSPLTTSTQPQHSTSGTADHHQEHPILLNYEDDTDGRAKKKSGQIGCPENTKRVNSSIKLIQFMRIDEILVPRGFVIVVFFHLV